MIPGYKVRNISVEPGLVLSPMSGVTCSAFRTLIKRCNPGHVGMLVSEFISVEGMTRQQRRSLEMMRYRSEEHPFVIQIFGYDIERMRDAAKMVQDIGADMVDINCGCPAPKVVKRGGGCELMRQPDHLRNILSAVRKAVTIPLTIKIRAGWDEESRNALEVAKMAESEGVEALAIHARTRAQLYRGEADWGLTQQVAAELKIPVMGSGDVVDTDSALKRMQDPVRGLFIGRGALYNPFVFSDVMKGEKTILRNHPERALAVLELYVRLLEEDCSPRASIGKLKQLVSQMCRGFEWRKELCRAETFEEQKQLLANLRARVEHGESIASGCVPVPEISLQSRRNSDFTAC